MMANIDKYGARQTRPILTNTRSSGLHVLYKIGALKRSQNSQKKHLCWSVFNKGVAWTL